MAKGNEGGRPPKVWKNTPRNLKKVKDWCAEGYTLKSIARQFKVSEDTFRKWRKENPQLAQAIDDGNAIDDQLCRNRLRETAFSTHRNFLTALLAYGKIKHHWNDGSRVDAAEKPSAPKMIPVLLDDDGSFGESSRSQHNQPADESDGGV